MPTYRVCISEVITNEAILEMEAESEEEIEDRIYEMQDYDPEVLEPENIEVFIGYITKISD